MAELAENKETPTKISARNPVCRLCCESKECRHVIKIFSETGLSQGLCQKVELSCGISVTENDTKSKVLCRSCVSFVNKICNFITKVRGLQNNCDERSDEAFSVKRCVEVSPSSCQPAVKRLTSTGSCRQQLFNEEPQRCPANILPNGHIDVDSQSRLSEKQQQMLSRALNAKDTNVLAFILKQHRENIVTTLLKLLLKYVSLSSAKLCKRSQGSVLYGNDYQSLKYFSYNNIWMELKDNFAMLVEFMSAIAGEERKMEDIGESLRVKYSFLYSILMSERWHELNLVKRVNTVLIVEGGCTKQVQM
jgi:hypothetical protein